MDKQQEDQAVDDVLGQLVGVVRTIREARRTQDYARFKVEIQRRLVQIEKGLTRLSQSPVTPENLEWREVGIDFRTIVRRVLKKTGWAEHRVLGVGN